METGHNPNFKGAPRTREDVRPDHDRKIQRLIADSLENKSREKIALEMTARLRWRITRSMIDDFAAGNKVTARFPASFVSAFCDACGDDQLRLEVMGERLRRLVEFAQRILRAARTRREMRSLIAFAQGSLASGNDSRELRDLLAELLKEDRRG